MGRLLDLIGLVTIHFPRSTPKNPLSNSVCVGAPAAAEAAPGRPRETLQSISRDRLSRRATNREDFRSTAKAASTRRSGKEVIQPQVPLRLPCYDFAPVTALAFGRLLSACAELRHGLRALTASMA
jgi:hypothetical protein